jgi:hypothetical protein
MKFIGASRILSGKYLSTLHRFMTDNQTLRTPIVMKLLFVALGALFLSAWWQLARLLYPDYEFLLDARDIAKGPPRIAYHMNNGTIKEMAAVSAQEYKLLYPITRSNGETITFDFMLTFETSCCAVKMVLVNGAEIDKRDLILVSEELPAKEQGFHFYVIRVANPAAKTSLIKTVTYPPFILAALLTIWLVWRALVTNKVDWLYLPIYTKAAFAHIKPTDIAVASVIFPLTFFSVVGCDAHPMYNMLRLWSSGIDIYQFQVNHKAYLNFSFLNFPYNPIMLFLGSAVQRSWDLFFGSVGLFAYYPYFQVASLRLFNLLLLLGTILSILSFLIEHKIVSKNIRAIFYLSLFNPVSFYVALLFVQIDTLPMYLTTLGVLLLANFERYHLLSVVLISLGLLCKIQMAVQAPILIILYLLFLLFKCNLSWVKRALICALDGGLALFLGYLFYLKPHSIGTAFNYLLTNFTQRDRIWFTVIQYVPGVFMYVSLFSLIVFYLFSYLNLRSTVSRENLVLHALLTIGCIVSIFSFSYLHTPSSLLHLTAAFVIAFALTDDLFSRLVIFFGSALIIPNWTFSDVGDISQILTMKVHLFTDYIRGMDDPARVKFYSLLFTTSIAALFAYGVFFLNQARNIAKR